MADDVRIKFSAEGDQSLKTSIKAINEQIKTLNETVKTSSEAMKGMGDSEAAAATKSKALQDIVSANEQKLQLLGKQYEDSKKKLDSLAQAMEEAKKSGDPAAIDKASNAYNKQAIEVAKLETAMSKAEGEIKQAENQIESLGNEMDETGKDTKELGNEMESASNKTDKLGEGFTVLKGVLANLITEGIQKFGQAVKDSFNYALTAGMDFEAKMSEVRAISGATGTEFAKLSDKAQEMGAKTKFSATQAAEAFNYMAMAGWKTESMIDGISGIMNLAAASGEELATTSDIVTDALTAFGKSSAEAGRLADIMAAASSNANTNVGMMGETFKYAAPVAGSLGYSMEDTALAIGLMANAGIKASQAGTSLRSIMSRMAAPTAAVSNAMNVLGVSLTNDNGEMLSLREVMEQLRESFGGGALSEEEFAARLEHLDNQLAKGNLQVGDYTLALDDLSAKFSAGEITAEEYDKQFKMLDYRLKNGEIAIGSYEKAVQDLMVSMYGAEGAQRAELASMIAGKNAMSGFLAILSASEEDWNKLTAAIDNSSNAYVKVRDGSVMLLSEAQAAGLEVIQTFSGAAEAMSSIMQDNLAGSITLLQSATEGLAINFYNAFSGTMKTGVDGLTTAVSALTEKMKAWAQTDEAKAMLERLLVAVQNVVNSLLNNLEPIIEGIIKTFEGLVKGITFVVENFDKIVTVIKTAVTAFVGLKTAMAAINFITLISNPVGATVAAIGALVAILVTLVTQWDRVKQGAKLLWEDVKNGASSAMEKIKSVWGNVGQWFEDRINAVKKTFSDIVDKVAKPFKTAYENITKTFNSIGQWFTERATAVKNAFANIPSAIGGFFTNAWTSVTSAWSSASTYFSNIGHNIKSAISGALSNLFSLAYNWARDMMQGFANGITAFIGTVIAPVKNLADKIASFLHFTKPDEGPLRDYETWMPHFVQGLARSLEKSAPVLTRAAEGLASNLQLDTSAITLGLDAADPMSTQPIYLQVNGQTFARLMTPYIDQVQGSAWESMVLG